MTTADTTAPTAGDPVGGEADSSDIPFGFGVRRPGETDDQCIGRQLREARRARGEYSMHGPAFVAQGELAERGAHSEQQEFVRVLGPVNAVALISAETIYNLYLQMRRALKVTARAIEPHAPAVTYRDMQVAEMTQKMWASSTKIAMGLRDMADQLQSDPTRWSWETARNLGGRVRSVDPALDSALRKQGKTQSRLIELRTLVTTAYETKYGSLFQAATVVRAEAEKVRTVADEGLDAIPPLLLLDGDGYHAAMAAAVVESGTPLITPGVGQLQKAIAQEYEMFEIYQSLGPDHVAFDRRTDLPPGL